MTDKNTISDHKPVTGRDETSRADPRQRRHAAKLTQIVAEAWDLGQRDGLSSISLRDLAERADLRQPSLYGYFDSKLGLYDLMYADALRQLLAAAAEELPPNEDPGEALIEFIELCIRFSSENVVRHELLFERTIPGFKPSPESRELLVQFRNIAAARLAAAGVRGRVATDVFTGIVSGFTQQQVISEPGGDRWLRLARPAIEIFLAGVPLMSEPRRSTRPRPTRKKNP
ncbi:MAG: TetR/AcrR family transcriptional regulator [Acidimicrobiales bacterium]